MTTLPSSLRKANARSFATIDTTPLSTSAAVAASISEELTYALSNVSPPQTTAAPVLVSAAKA